MIPQKYPFFHIIEFTMELNKSEIFTGSYTHGTLYTGVNMTRPALFIGETEPVSLKNMTGVFLPDPDPRFSHNDIFARKMKGCRYINYTLKNPTFTLPVLGGGEGTAPAYEWSVYPCERER